MFYLLAQWLEFEGLFNVFRYLSFRSGAAVATALFIGMLIGPRFINMLRMKQGKGQPIREDGPITHLKKAGTPTMGGLMILLSVVISTLLWMDLSNIFVWVCIFVTLGFGAIGFMDDYDKVSKASHKGVPGRVRLLMEFVVAGFATWTIVQQVGTNLYVPFFNDVQVNLGWFYFPFAMFVIVGSGNAVNLTDGLDGLATMPVAIASATFLILVYLSGNAVFSEYLGIPFVPGAGELAIFCACIIGACLAFLWFNAPPAAVFMGDTGSLALGGALGAIAVSIHHEIVLAIVGGLFVLEAVSVIVQVFFFKRTGKRVFRMAPLHHHFELKGWAEPKIIVRFWILTVIFALISLSTLKLR